MRNPNKDCVIYLKLLEEIIGDLKSLQEENVRLRISIERLKRNNI